jgi:NAD(P)H-flavin reductase
MLPRRFRVAKALKETYDTFTLDLVPLEGKGDCCFLPGQFNMLYAFGVGEIPISISGDPSDARMYRHTIRMVGKVSQALRGLKPGGVVGLRGPFGTFWPVEQAKARDVVLVAGGVGLLPLRPVLYHLVAHRREYSKVALLYGARTPEDLMYPQELENWRKRFDLEVDVTVDKASHDWRGRVGVVTTLIPRAGFDISSALAMVCGPEVMIHFTTQELLKMGMKASQVFVSMERNMKCALGLCGHCQYAAPFVCKDGPVFCLEKIAPWLNKREV